MTPRAKRNAITAVLLFGLSLPVLGLSLPAAAADDTANAKPATTAADAEFGGECVMGLALGKDIKTDCSVSTVYEGRTYCFGNEIARDLFLKKPAEFLLQAHVYYSSRKPQP